MLDIDYSSQHIHVSPIHEFLAISEQDENGRKRPVPYHKI